MAYGYMDNILRIDLSTGKVNKESLTSAMKQKYVGGMGCANRIL